MRCHLVVLETSGNQSYIFDTNKRRENVGASHLIASVGVWVVAAIQEIVPGWRRGDRLPDAPAELVTEAAGSVKVLVTDPEDARELVTKVTLHALGEAAGLDVCGVVEEFDWDEESGADNLHNAVVAAGRRLPLVRASRPGPAARFLRIPIVAPCTSSGLPAAEFYDEVSAAARADEEQVARREAGTVPHGASDGAEGERRDPPQPRSPQSLAKLRAVDRKSDGAYDRLARLTLLDGASDGVSGNDVEDNLGSDPNAGRDVGEAVAGRDSGDASGRAVQRTTPGEPDDRKGPGGDPTAARDAIGAVADHLGRHADWVAIVHADGNGVGSIFRNFRDFVVGSGSRDYADALRLFSMALDKAAAAAYREAFEALDAVTPVLVERRHRDGRRDAGAALRRVPPVLPLVLGGDDLTVICDGAVALPFTAEYLEKFEAATERLFAEIPDTLLRKQPPPKPAVAAGNPVAADKRLPSKPTVPADTPDGSDTPDGADDPDGTEKRLPPNLTVAAGIAIVKRNYPFFSAYRLVEDLIDEAKVVKKKAPGASALAFHVLHDSAATQRGELRDRVTFPKAARRPGSGTPDRADNANDLRSADAVTGTATAIASGADACASAGGADSRRSEERVDVRLVAQPYVVTEPPDDPDATVDEKWLANRRWPDLVRRVEVLRGSSTGDQPFPRSQAHDLRAGLFAGQDVAQARFELIRHRYDNSGIAGLAVDGDLFWDDGDGHVTGLLDAMDAEAFLPRRRDDGSRGANGGQVQS